MHARLTSSFAALALLAIAVAGVVINPRPAIAQQTDDDQTSDGIEEVVKLEATLFRRAVVGRTAHGAKIEDIELSGRVNYADLDLSKHADVTELKTRIETTAKELCEELSDMSPFDPLNRREMQRCRNHAVDNTDDEVQAAIAAAS